MKCLSVHITYKKKTITSELHQTRRCSCSQLSRLPLPRLPLPRSSFTKTGCFTRLPGRSEGHEEVQSPTVTMANPTSADITLQLCFGIVAIIGILVALAGLHHRDSLGCVLCRRCHRRRAPRWSLPVVSFATNAGKDSSWRLACRTRTSCSLLSQELDRFKTVLFAPGHYDTAGC